MENYHRRPKATKSKFEDDNDSEIAAAGASKTNKQHNAPQQHGVMVISPHGKIRTYVTRALEILTEADSPESQGSAEPTSEGASREKDKAKTASISSQNQKATPGPSIQQSQSATSSNRSNKTRGVLTIKAQGRSITKAVTVAEILKRRMEGSLHQFTEIGQITEQEIWDPNPDVPNLDPLTVSRHRPTIRIRLSKHLDTPSSANSSSGLLGVDPNMPGASIPRDEHADDVDEEDDDEGEAWPGAILDRDAAARRFVGYQAPTGNDIYL